MKLLVVEDDDDIASLLRRGLSAEGYEVDRAGTGEEALDMVRGAHYAAILLDVMLPGCSGLDVCRRLRRRSHAATIIILSARDAVPDRIEGLSAGADDYLVKPFAFEELIARLRAQERRRAEAGGGGAGRDGLVTSGRLAYDPATRLVSLGDRRVELTEREADLLLFLIRNAGKPVSREAIFVALWEGQGGVALNVVDVYVGYLRRKLAGVGEDGRAALRTVRGVGFMFEPP